MTQPVDPAEFTPYFSRRRVFMEGQGGGTALYCDGVSLERIARAVGTPAYVYSRNSIADAYRRLDRAFGSLPHRLCYALKANGNLSILRVLARLGSSFDIVSGGELERLRQIGIPGGRIVFSGVGKTREEIRAAIRYRLDSSGKRGILLFNVESPAELELLVEEAALSVGKGSPRVSAAIRVNPDILAGGHPHISTGYRHHKFGMEWREALRLYLSHRNSPWIAWRGISAHIGSQILDVTPFRRAAERLASYVRELADAGIHLDYLDIGGGLGIRYTDETPGDPAAYARELATVVRPLKCTLLLEPGRALVGPAGVLLTRVLYVKENGGRKFVIVDAAMNDLIRPSLYGATHALTKAALLKEDSTTVKPVDVVGPVCESGDFLAHDWPLPDVKSGDLLVVWAAGAYGFVQSSNYNARLRAPEVLVDAGRFRIVRRRQNFADLVRGEEL
ncbi:MAG TPA: diaminopimelate decarboxylase [Candidatus Acidoferrales bacterium]|nr:diaminopimelate decarboxylase [Candidatus Acidoferrales bacterium]